MAPEVVTVDPAIERLGDFLKLLNAQVSDGAVELAEAKIGLDEPGMAGFVYLAGPYRSMADIFALDGYITVDANINEARRWAARMAEAGIPYFCPHLNSAHMEVIVPEVPPAFWLDMDLEVLSHAAALFLIPGWRESKGARAELAYAQEVGMPIYTHLMYEKFVNEWRSGAIRRLIGNAVHQSDSQEPHLGTKPDSDNGGGVELRADWSDTYLA